MEELYKNELINFLQKEIDFKKYDKEIEESNLYFGKSISIKNKLSEYFELRNNLYIENLSEEEKNTLNSDNKQDVYELIKNTYKKVITKENANNIMYDPPMPSHYVKNGSLVLTFIYGRNTEEVEDNKYKDLIIKQKQFIENIVKEITNEIKNKINIDTIIFIEKRI